MIYISIPVRDEERTIGVLLWKVRKVMAAFGRPYEVVVLDDASGDSTPQVLARYDGVLPLHVIRSEKPLGYGSAVELLLREIVSRSSYPKRDIAITLQGDFTEDPQDLVGMVKTIEGGADLVVGSPFLDGRGVPASHRVSRWLAPLVLGKAFRGAPVKDPLSGFRAYRVIVLKKAVQGLDEGRSLVAADGWGANLELLFKVAPYARRIAEAPITADFLRRERTSRFRALPSLYGLLGLRRTVWPSSQESS